MTVPELISHLTTTFDGKQATPPPPPPPTLPNVLEEDEEVAVHVIYKKTRVDGIFNKANHELRITKGPLAGRTFSSPSNAAIAVVEKLNPAREFSNTNGRTFWLVTATGRTLRSIIGQR
ncbi:hypothetical protein SAMN05421684_4283 [Asanoa ishikariensis]|uniref:RAMA domain-containing protein n=2 Tax=Asanoa ishikariensis TaxID=137265 RepID=A0A1H3RX01_9ACTN|nr:hypothetical protein SAMN05421684_4283 [Asanoa ishikariensis]